MLINYRGLKIYHKTRQMRTFICELRRKKNIRLRSLACPCKKLKKNYASQVKKFPKQIEKTEHVKDVFLESS